MQRALRTLRSVLAEHGPLTRAEVAARLDACGVPLEGQARPHLLARAALEGTICAGPDRDGEPTWVLLADWLPGLRVLPREVGLERLAARYLAAFGPAAPADLAAWSGLPASDVRAAWQHAGDLVEVEVSGRDTWLPRAFVVRLQPLAPDRPVTRLLGAFDTYLLGYRDRDLVVPAAYARHVHPGGGIIRPVVLCDGRVVGTWRVIRSRGGTQVRVEAFSSLSPAVEEGLAAESADVERFLGTRRGTPSPDRA